MLESLWQSSFHTGLVYMQKISSLLNGVNIMADCPLKYIELIHAGKVIFPL